MTTTAPGRPLACAWCGAPLHNAARRPPRLSVCRHCGAATTDPQPSTAELDDAYGRWYRPESGRFSGPGDVLLARSRGLLARRLDRIAPPGPVLDVGSGAGDLLRALRHRGREAVGVERSSDAPGARAVDLRDLDGPFAAIVFWHSLEHLRDSGDVVRHAARILGPRGVVVIAMPNYDSVQARIFGERWLALDLPRHLVHVPASALLAMLNDADLQTERVSYLRGGQVLFGWLHGLTGRLPGRPNLYDALRRDEARSRPMRRSFRAATLAAATCLAPVALAATLAETAARRGGTVYVEARRL